MQASHHRLYPCEQRRLGSRVVSHRQGEDAASAHHACRWGGASRLNAADSHKNTSLTTHTHIAFEKGAKLEAFKALSPWSDLSTSSSPGIKRQSLQATRSRRTKKYQEQRCLEFQQTSKNSGREMRLKIEKPSGGESASAAEHLGISRANQTLAWRLKEIQSHNLTYPCK